MLKSLDLMAVAFALIPDAVAIALPQDNSAAGSPGWSSVMSILCDAESTKDAGCTSFLATATITATYTATTTTTSLADTTLTFYTHKPFAPTPITVPAACASGAVPNDNTQSCWKDMGLETYVSDWWRDNGDSCDNTAAHPNDDDSTTSFANCWFKLMVPNESPTNCDVLNTGTSCSKPSWSDFEGDNFEANFWVTWSIYNVNTWWTSMNTAIIASDSSVSSVVGKVITTMNPPKPAETPEW